MTLYYCSTAQLCIVADFKFHFGQNVEFGNFSPLCHPRVSKRESVMLTEYATLQNILL